MQILLCLATLYTNSKSSRLVFQVVLSRQLAFENLLISASENASSRMLHRWGEHKTSYAHTYVRTYIYIQNNSNSARDPTRAFHVDYSSYVSYAYCIYALVGGAISIRDPYICAISRVRANKSPAVFHRPIVCAVKTKLQASKLA